MKLRKLIIKEDHALVPLTQNQYAMIDLEDIERVGKYNWYVNKGPRTYYAIRDVLHGRDINNKRIREKILQHREVLNVFDSKMDIDHIDGNGLNNRKRNLRTCTHSQNLRNAKKRKNCSSRFKGVCWPSRDKKWLCTVQHGKTQKFLGYFESEIEAAKAYDAAALKYFGKFARTNRMLRLL